MKADITFHVEFAESTKFKITCGSVDGDGIPVPLYMGLLSALVEFQDRINGDDKPYVYRPVLGRQGSKPVTDNDSPITSPGESLKEMGALREDVIENTIKVECDTPAKFRRIIPDIPPPPVPFYPPHSPKTVVTTNKMRKAYTEEEKNEIAQLYQDGLQVNEIARRFGRKPESIYKLVSAMGVKRNQKREYEKPEVIAASDASDQPKAKRECTLKKPWYLQRQTPNNRDKAKHE